MNNKRSIIRLKDVPSNVIEEAIIIFKENKKAKKFEYSSKFENENKTGEDDKDYVIKEAELVISKYLNPDNSKEEKLKRKIKNQKIISAALGFLLLISIIL